MSDDRQDPLWGDEPPPDAKELQDAKELAEQLEELAAGRWPAGPSELLPAVGLIQASTREQPLAPERLEALVQQAVTGAQLGRARRQRRGWLPAAALAASVLLAVSALLLLATPRDRAPASAALAPMTLSRSSDALLGGPIVDRAGASQRLDLVFADRLRSYRRLTLDQKEMR